MHVLFSFGAIQAGSIIGYVPDISSARGAAEDMLHLVDSHPEIDAEATDGKMIDVSIGRIQLKNVHFRYRKCLLSQALGHCDDTRFSLKPRVLILGF